MKRNRSFKKDKKHGGEKSIRRFGKKIELRSKPKKEEKVQVPLPTHVVGIVARAHFGWTLLPTDRRDDSKYVIRPQSSAEKYSGELVVAEIAQSSKSGRKEIVIKNNLGEPDDPRNVSLIAIHANEIPNVFSDATIREAEDARPVQLGNRTDLRTIPLVTIDGADARDFDDAVFAEADASGWHLIVAIADVSHYVRHDSALDNTAYERGNSVYFPDRVVPMLPEALSNNLCSLMPNVERACMAVHLWITHDGELKRWQFVRGLMESCARLTYEQVQTAFNGKPDKTTAPLLDKVIKPLYGAYASLAKARLKRGALELELPERKIELDKDGTVKAIKQRDRLDSHKLIEEFMIMANVAAASQLESKGGICIYRVHDKPSEMKLFALREFLESMDISLVPAKQLHPSALTNILKKVENAPQASVVNEVMLRSQAQAVYSSENIGHFGLALGKYAHFTSPIRRYADLMVHRALIRAGKLGGDGLTDHEKERLAAIAEHISVTERRAVTAERDAMDRFTTLFMSDKIGAEFPARISGVARFGLFARLDQIGADGFIPIRSLPRDYYFYDEKTQSLRGERHKRTYQLATPVKIKLNEADRLTGSMTFEIVEEDADKSSVRKKDFHRKSRRSR